MSRRSTRVILVGIAVLIGGIVLLTRPVNRDLSGDWTNATQTPLERLGDQQQSMADEQAAALENRAPRYSRGGEMFQDTGLRVLRIAGEARTSIIIDPPNGRLPPRTDEGQQRLAAIDERRKRLPSHPETRTLGERCLVSFGSNAGPPMLPNYLYNNNYTIVQTADQVLIFTEMNHDVRIIPIGEKTARPSRMRPWFGESVGRWEGSTLVVETTNLHPLQLEQTSNWWAYRAASDRLTVTEWLTRADADTLHYRFTVEDPGTYTAPFTGELTFTRLNEMIYEYACHEGNYSMPHLLAAPSDTPRP
jgi:hypothetical protein